LIIEPEASQDGSRKKRPADESSGCDLKDLNALSGCYITAELTNSFFSNGDSQVFEVGDDKTYGGYRNKPLAPGYNYKLHQGVTIKLSVRHKSNFMSHLWFEKACQEKLLSLFFLSILNCLEKPIKIVTNSNYFCSIWSVVKFKLFF